jgi:hypothetical protein
VIRGWGRARFHLGYAATLAYLNRDKTHTKRRPNPDQAQANAVVDVCFVFIKYVLYMYLRVTRGEGDFNQGRGKPEVGNMKSSSKQSPRLRPVPFDGFFDFAQDLKLPLH